MSPSPSVQGAGSRAEWRRLEHCVFAQGWVLGASSTKQAHLPQAMGFLSETPCSLGILMPLVQGSGSQPLASLGAGRGGPVLAEGRVLWSVNGGSAGEFKRSALQPRDTRAAFPVAVPVRPLRLPRRTPEAAAARGAGPFSTKHERSAPAYRCGGRCARRGAGRTRRRLRGQRAVSGSAPWRAAWLTAAWLTAALALQVAPAGTRWSRSGGTRRGTWRRTKTPSCRSTSGGSTRATCSWSCAAPGPLWASGRPRTAWLASRRGRCTGRACRPWPSWGLPATNPWRGGNRKGNPSPSLGGAKG